MLSLIKYILTISCTVIILTLQGCTSSPTSQSNAPYVPPNYSEGISNLHQQNFNMAFRQLIPLAVQGDANARYAIGYLYYYGKGVDQNSELSESWITRAAKQRQPMALQAYAIINSHPNATGLAEIPSP
jgi:TPR repeat protein